MTFAELLARIIEDGLAEVRAAYADPKDAVKLAGAIAGFEACRDKPVDALAELYAELDRACVESRRVDAASNNVYWEKRHATLQVEWVCNVISVGLIQQARPPLLPWLPTVRGGMRYAAIVGVSEI